MSFIKDLPLYTKSDLRYLCSHLIPFTSLKTMHYGSNFCPFHYNVNTPSASLFKDRDGVERMYCYTCKRQYTSYDYITLVMEKDPLKLLLDRFSKEELDEALKFKVNKYEEYTAKIEFKDIRTLLEDLYNFDKCLNPLEM